MKSVGIELSMETIGQILTAVSIAFAVVAFVLALVSMHFSNQAIALADKMARKAEDRARAQGDRGS